MNSWAVIMCLPSSSSYSFKEPLISAFRMSVFSLAVPVSSSCPSFSFSYICNCVHGMSLNIYMYSWSFCSSTLSFKFVICRYSYVILSYQVSLNQPISYIISFFLFLSFYDFLVPKYLHCNPFVIHS